MMLSLPRVPVRLKRFSSRASSLLLLAQRSPLVQLMLPEAKIASSAGLGEIVKFSIATFAGLGAYDTVSGASSVRQLTPVLDATTVSVTAGNSLSFVFNYTGSDTPDHFKVTGTMPPGLTQTGSTDSKSDSITGIATTPGTYSITITAWRDSAEKSDKVSKAFTVSVTGGTPPSITSQPASVTINSGGTTTLTVTATGTVPTYQWYKGTSGTTTSPISGATSASYTTAILTADTKYWVRVKNSLDSVDSNTATVTVKTPPTITTQPASVSITSGGTTTLTVVPAGTAPFTYQWYEGNAGTTTNPVSGATSASFKTPALTATKTYWVRVTNSVSSKNSTAATVTVTSTPPAITSHPASVSISSGTTGTFTVVASGTAPFTYQWYEGESGTTTAPIAGAISNSYTTGALTASKSFWVRVTNSASSVDSTAAVATIAAVVTPFESWRAGKSLTGGAGDDDDKDGLSNLLEYTFGLDPQVADSSSPGSFASDPSDAQFLVLTFPLSPQATDVTPVFQRSSLNGEWTPIPESDPTYVITRASGQISIRIPKANPSEFFRLSAMLN